MASSFSVEESMGFEKSMTSGVAGFVSTPFSRPAMVATGGATYVWHEPANASESVRSTEARGAIRMVARSSEEERRPGLPHEAVHGVPVLVAQGRAGEEDRALEVEEEVLHVSPLEATIELGAVVVAGLPAVEVHVIVLVRARRLALRRRDGIDDGGRRPREHDAAPE